MHHSFSLFAHFENEVTRGLEYYEIMDGILLAPRQLQHSSISLIIGVPSRDQLLTPKFNAVIQLSTAI